MSKKNNIYNSENGNLSKRIDMVLNNKLPSNEQIMESRTYQC